MKQPIRIALVDDSPDLRENITGYLEAFPEFKCVNTYASAESALAGLPRDEPDIVLMDINLGENVMDGIQCVRHLKVLLPKVQIVMLTVFEDSRKIFRTLAAGASGYLLKRQRPDELVAAIREVVAGGAPMSTPIARIVVKSFQSAPDHDQKVEELSERERQVLQGLAQGLVYKQIAEELDVSIHTVRNYIRRIYEKLHVRTGAEAVAKYLKP
jgi:DNA-binding NarL/FixJ family response regulator